MINKLEQLVNCLKSRNNKAYNFFENVLYELQDEKRKPEALIKLASCFSITQYADFKPEEEKLLSEIIEEIN